VLQTTGGKEARPWILVVAEPGEAAALLHALAQEVLPVQVAGDAAQLAQVLATGDPLLALIDLDAPHGPVALTTLTVRPVALAALSRDLTHWRRAGVNAPILIEKPLSARALHRLVDGLVGRR
jgi:DNA-binding response OmpR family regulator